MRSATQHAIALADAADASADAEAAAAAQAAAAASVRDVAVLMRTNAQFRVLERELIRQGVAHVLVNGTRFFERREVRHVVCIVP